MSGLPALSAILSSPGNPDSPLAAALSMLFEPSAVLVEKLVPELSRSLPSQVDSYSSLIDLSISKISSWEPRVKSAFIAAHPRIGELTNLSNLSRNEQAAKATSLDILFRLAQLNALYERRYPGLRYITFVNGRSRAEIKDEMESKLGDYVTVMAGPGGGFDEVAAVKVGGCEWLAELDRAIGDVAKIAKGRLNALGVA